MTTIHLTARITEDGHLPEGLPAGEVHITIEFPDEEQPLEGFREGWRDVMEGRLYPAATLWEDIEDDVS